MELDVDAAEYGRLKRLLREVRALEGDAWRKANAGEAAVCAARCAALLREVERGLDLGAGAGGGNGGAAAALDRVAGEWMAGGDVGSDRARELRSVLAALARRRQVAQAALRGVAPDSVRSARRRARVCVCAVGAVAAAGWIAALALRPDGATVTYYRGEGFEARIGVRRERALVRAYDSGRPVWRAGRDHWSARWEGYLWVPVTTQYSFYVQSDDGVRVSLGGRMGISNWQTNTWRESGRHWDGVFLKEGSYRLVVEHFNATGPASVRLRWTGGPIRANTVVGAPYLRRVPRGAVRRLDDAADK